MSLQALIDKLRNEIKNANATKTYSDVLMLCEAAEVLYNKLEEVSNDERTENWDEIDDTLTRVDSICGGENGKG